MYVDLAGKVSDRRLLDFGQSKKLHHRPGVQVGKGATSMVVQHQAAKLRKTIRAAGEAHFWDVDGKHYDIADYVKIRNAGKELPPP